MVDEHHDPSTDDPAVARRTRRRAASRPAGPPAPAAAPTEAAPPSAPAASDPAAGEAPAGTKRAAVKKTGATKSAAKKTATKKTTAKAAAADAPPPEQSVSEAPDQAAAPAKTAKKATAKRATAKKSTATKSTATKSDATAPEADAVDQAPAEDQPARRTRRSRAAAAPLFQAPETLPAADTTEPQPTPDGEPAGKASGKGARKGTRKATGTSPAPAETAAAETAAEEPATEEPVGAADAGEPESEEEGGTRRRRRRRGGRGRRRKTGEEPESDGAETSAAAEEAAAGDAEPSSSDEGEAEESEGTGSRRRRRRRRRGSDDAEPRPDDPPNTVVKVRRGRGTGDEVTALRGSTRLEAKKQRRREGREAGRRRAPILTEAEFLARRESVDRVMAVRQRGERTQIAVLEDDVLVEHYVNKGSSTSMVGNVYLGRVQNVLPSMEAAFVDIGRGRNAVLYAGEVNWDAAGLDGQPRRIEFALKSGDSVLVQVTKEPLGHKGARLTSQVSLPGRYLVFVPDGSMTGISRKLPDTERSRLKSILKRVMPDDAGVIVRTAAEGASEDELERDVTRLQAQWAEISRKAKTASAPALLYGEPDLAIKVVRDMFNEDVSRLVVSGDGAWSRVNEYVTSVAPDLGDRLEKWVGPEDLFAAYRIDEQLTKALDRKVWLPSGGSLVIDRTEAMTVVDVNTGKFTGQGGNLEETVTRNNLEAAEEIVRQLRLRDIGGIIVVDFIDMVLESNRDLVLRRLVECLGRDRTKHQVAEVTSLGLVQMTRKRIGQGLLEVFSTTCDACHGRGIVVSLHDHDEPAAAAPGKRRRSGVDPAEVAARALAEREVDEVADEMADEVADVEADEVSELVEAGELAEVVEVAELVEAVDGADVDAV